MSRFRRPRFVVPAVVLALVASGLTFQLRVANQRPPSFNSGGDFLSAEELPIAGRDGRPYPYGDASELVPTTTTRARTEVAGRTLAQPSDTVTTPTTTVASVLPQQPRDGTYAYAVDGSESVTGFGSRKFPATMGLVVHPNEGSDDQKVFDLRFSDDHEEREIVSFGPTGLAFVYEGGSITFGPGTQTSEGTYKPAMVQVPWPLGVGATVGETSSALGRSGATQRKEKWVTKITGQETLTVLGQQIDTWIVEIQRNTTPGSSDQVDRFRRYWYSPELGIWVKWYEKFHGSRKGFVDFNYDAEYTATLSGFTAT